MGNPHAGEHRIQSARRDHLAGPTLPWGGLAQELKETKAKQTSSDEERLLSSRRRLSQNREQKLEKQARHLRIPPALTGLLRGPFAQRRYIHSRLLMSRSAASGKAWGNPCPHRLVHKTASTHGRYASQARFFSDRQALSTCGHPTNPFWAWDQISTPV